MRTISLKPFFLCITDVRLRATLLRKRLLTNVLVHEAARDRAAALPDEKTQKCGPPN